MTQASTTLTLLLALSSLGGCAASSPTVAHTPLGRAFAAAPGSASTAPAPSGDPPAERHGMIATDAAREQSTPSVLAPTPKAALQRYALLYANWRADSLSRVERRLAALAVGAARLTAEQIAASHSTTTALAAEHVQNTGVVLSIAPGQGPARGQWIVVTQEQTTGAGPYAGLPPSLHVTLARTQRFGQGWAISSWRSSI
jgi:hypothetical protein